MRSLIRFFAKEHLFGNLITLLVLVFGLYSLTMVRRDIWPKVELHITNVRALLPGASPEQIEKLIINPLEASLKEVDGLKKVYSTSTESTGVIVLQLDPDARNPKQTNDDIQRAVDQTEDLPEDATKPLVTIIDSGIIPIIEVTISGESDPMVLRDTAKHIADDLSLMSGVARVTKQGYRKKEFLIEADADKLSQRNVSLSHLINSIKARNVSMPGGSIVTKKGMETLVRAEGQYVESQNLLETFIIANDFGLGTQIKDVAQVSETLAKPELLYRANGEESINLVVSKKEKYDVLKLVQQIKDKVISYQKRFGEKIKFNTSNDFSVYLNTRIKALGSNLIIGLLLVVLFLSLLLPWQVTLVVAIGIPIALLSTILVAYLAGLSLNLLSLMGLIIVLGMLVDDAIVVSENIWRHIENGEDVLSSVVDGASEVFGPVLASVLTTVSAFGPMLFMTGIFGAFVFEIPMMVILALSFSLFEAFIIMPPHFVSWVGPFVQNIKSKKSNQPSSWDKFLLIYKDWITWTLKRRYIILIINVFIFLGSIALVATTGKFVLFPAEGVEIFFVQVEADEGVSVKKMEELVMPIEQQILKTLPKGELLDVVTHIGIIQQDMMDPLTRRGSHVANIRVTLTAQSERERSAEDIIEFLRPQIQAPDLVKKVSYELVQQGPPQGRPISINLIGESFEVLSKMSEEFKNRIAKIEGVKDIRDSYQMGKVEWQVNPRNNEASYGLTFFNIAETVRAAFDGIVASSVRALDEEIDIRVKLQKQEGSIEEQLQSIKIGNNQGNLVNLAAVANFEPQRSLSSISHTNFKRMINVSAGVDTEIQSALAVNQKIEPLLKEITSKVPGYSFESSGEDKDTQESMQSLVVSFVFAACIIFSLLIVTFKSLLQPLLILASIPLGFIGVIWAMFIHGRPFSFMAMLGVIALAGVIVNNAIVFTDFVNRRRSEGRDLDESIIDSATTRLRPILLTTVTTICGLLPTAYGDKLRMVFGFGGGDPFVIPIALALGWGLAFGSSMTGLFFPAFIRILDDIELFLKRGLRFKN